MAGNIGKTRILDLSNLNQPKFSDKIEGFENHINVIHPINQTHYLVAGNSAETRILDLSDLNQLKFSDKIEGFEGSVYSLQQIDQTHYLVVGSRGETRILEKKLDLDQVEESK